MRSAEPENTLSFDECCRYLQREGALWALIRELARDLERNNIAFCFIGGIALFLHGYERVTTNVDLLIAPSNLPRLRDVLLQRGAKPAIQGATRAYELPLGVRLDAFLSGQLPGTGEPEPVAFPNPAQTFVVKEGLPVVPLETLIDLKLASGLGAPGRLKDLADVQELIRYTKLPAHLAEQLSPYVRETYLMLWRELEVLYVQTDAPHSERPQ